MRKLLPYIAVMLSMVIWAGAGIAVKAALTVLPPFTLLITRFTGSVLLMLGIGLLFKRHHTLSHLLGLQSMQRQDLGMFLLAGLFQPVLYFIFETYSYRAFASPTIAEAILSINPLIAPIFAAIFLREQITRNNIVGILISTAGMFVLVLAGSENFELGNPWGIPLAIITVCMSASYNIMLRKIPGRYSPLSIIFYVQALSLLVFYPLWGIVDGQHLQEWWMQINPEQVSTAVKGTLYLITMSSAAAFMLYCYCVRLIGVTHANVFNNIKPVFTALLMLALFGEQLPFGKWVGIFITIIGLYISQRKEVRGER